MPSVQRIIDANANRAREALRVMEEAARFILNDSQLTDSLKTLRHDLADTLAGIPGLQASRDTPGDVGTELTTEREGRRTSVGDITIAAGSRLSEALRAIEEYAKMLGQCNGVTPAQLAARIESLRYRGYSIEQHLNQSLATGRARQWKLCVLVTAAHCFHYNWLDVARIAWEAGADCVQLREKDVSDRELLRRARQLANLPNRGTLIINDRPAVALLSGADGVHLGQKDLSPAEVRQIVGDQLIIGVSTAKMEEARRARRDGADYCGVGPMFTTTTKHKDLIVGPKYLRQFIEWGQLPHLAISGITTDNVDELVEVGCQGVAVCAAVCETEDPGLAVHRLLEGMLQAQPAQK